jgi:hypothetical protein
VNSYGILHDEITDVSLMQHLVTFVKYENMDSGDATTEFLPIVKVQCIEFIAVKLRCSTMTREEF